MNREEARLELDATTLRPQDASAEAHAVLQSDAELREWHEKRTAFDQQAAQAAAAGAAGAGQPEAESAAKADDDNVVDAEFKEVKKD